MITDYVYAKHRLCGADLEWRCCGELRDDGTRAMDLFCPRCQRRVERIESSLQGTVSAVLREPHD